MSQSAKAAAFASLHQKGAPLVLYNIWDAGSAAAVAQSGAKALATGSAPVAFAQGYPDGEVIPLELAREIISRIVAATDLPVTADFEGGYARSPANITQNVSRMVETGIVGVNFEDQVIGASGLYDPQEQVSRIKAVRLADENLFINARTDLFLQKADPQKHAGLMAEAISRAALYARAGASGFFAPGLVDADLIETLCAAVELPVNILKRPGVPAISELGALGVSRVSYGPGPYKRAMADLTKVAKTL